MRDVNRDFRRLMGAVGSEVKGCGRKVMHDASHVYECKARV